MTGIQAQQQRAAVVLTSLLDAPLPAASWAISRWIPGLDGQLTAGTKARGELASWAEFLGTEVTEELGNDRRLRGYARAERDGVTVTMWAQIGDTA
jgi:hypothetical protein